MAIGDGRECSWRGTCTTCRKLKLRRSANCARKNVCPSRRSRFLLGGIQKLFLANVMFARVFDSAKRFLSRSPSYQGESDDIKPDIPRSAQPDAEQHEMVTTRRGTGTGTDVESTPTSAVRVTRGKRHLEVEAQQTPTATKRRRKGAAKEEPAAASNGAKTQASAEEPDEPDFVTKSMPHRAKNKKTYESAEARTPIARRSSPKIVIPGSSAADDAHESETASSQVDVFFTPAQHSFGLPADEDEREGSLTPKPAAKVAKATPTSGRGSGKRGRPRKNPAPASPEKISEEFTPSDEVPSSTWDSEQAPLTPTEEDNDLNAKPLVAEKDEAPEEQKETEIAQVPSKAKSTPAQEQVEDLASLGIAYEDATADATVAPPRRHKRFGSEEPALPLESTVQAELQRKTEVADDDDDASDSDDAPEMVTTSAAASKAKAVAEDRARANQAQQEKEEKRRKERADRIAQEQAEKREREEKKARKLAHREAKLARRQEHAASSPPRDPMDIDMKTLPDLLPESILEAAGDRRPPTPPFVRSGKTDAELRQEKLNRHIKFLERGEKPIKDVKKGKVNVSVLSQRNKLLAPQVNRDTKNIREHWLKGREADRKARGKKGSHFKKMERRAAPKGFLRGGDDD